MPSYLETLFLKSAKTGDLETLTWIFRVGVDPNIRNEYDATALYLACLNGHYKVVKFLLGMGVNLHLRTKSGRTPLDIAYTIENDEIVQILLDYGAAPYSRTREKSEDEIIFETPNENLSWFKRSPFLILRDVLQPGRFTILRRIRARIKYLFS